MPDPIGGNRRRRRVPIIFQQESAECGLTCLAMVAAFYGKRTPLDELRKLHGLSGRGTTFGDLLRTAKYLQLTARPLRLSLSELHRLRLPAVLHWRMDHFVVLVRYGRRHYLIHDPATGRRKVGPAEFDESFTGVALELLPARGFRRQSERVTLSFVDFAGSFRHLYRYLGLMLCLLLSTQVLALAPPIATQILIDELVLGQDRQWLYRALGGLALIMLTGVMLDGLRRWISLFTGTNLAVDSSVSVMSHLFCLPATFINSRHPGDLMSKLESLTPIRHALTDHVINSVVHSAVLLTTLAIMFLYSGWLTAVSLAGLALSALLMAMILPASRRLGEQAIIHTASQNSSLLESLRACDVVQALGLGHLRLAHWQNHFSNATNARVREGRLSIAQETGTGIIGVFEQVLFLGIGIAGVLDKHFTLGVLFAFMSLRARFGSAALGLAEAVQKFFLLKVHTGRLSDIVLAEPMPAIPAGAINSTIKGSLTAENIAFRYSAGPWIVRDFCCDIAAGINVVITGPSGCGKTTLLKLLAGHLPVNAGQIYVDNMDLPLWNRDSLRGQTGFVLQNDTLFQGTVTENISAFDTAPDLARLREAAIIAEIWPDIQNLPMKLQTQISDMGKNLSGGQVQRLVLARALYRRPVMLFLDEATSHLDVSMERRVLQNIRELGITVVSVAHRPEAINRAEQVISLGT
ncbi:MAG: peptidase domain-containing ABC transporter [Proteobacteria bacterium]|nr:peptidase domain-containing ABC transporter [Pseudomonadota bacterium]TDJ37205.1 MAG: peptidase domain-containing ABC transporter [Gammaproteobacteria bacterium]